MAAADVEALLLKTVDRDGSIADSGDFAAANGWDHNAVVGVIKSLEAAELVVTKVRALARLVLRCCAAALPRCVAAPHACLLLHA